MTQNKFGQILTKLMKECYLDDASLSKKVDIPVPTIARLRNSSNPNPTIATLEPIASFFNISIDQLIGRSELPSTRVPGTYNEVKEVSTFLPVIPWNEINFFLSNKSVIKQNFIKWAPTELKVADKSFFTKVTTDSFGLTLKKNSFLLITNDCNYKDGDLVILKKKNKEVIVPQQIVCDSDITYIKSTNPEIKGTKVLTNDYEVLGKIIEVRFNLSESSETAKVNPSTTVNAKKSLLTPKTIT